MDAFPRRVLVLQAGCHNCKIGGLHFEGSQDTPHPVIRYPSVPSRETPSCPYVSNAILSSPLFPSIFWLWKVDQHVMDAVPAIVADLFVIPGPSTTRSTKPKSPVQAVLAWQHYLGKGGGCQPRPFGLTPGDLHGASAPVVKWPKKGQTRRQEHRSPFCFRFFLDCARVQPGVARSIRFQPFSPSFPHAKWRVVLHRGVICSDRFWLRFPQEFPGPYRSNWIVLYWVL